MVAASAECDFIPWGALDGKTVAITGATGLIGSFVTDVLLERIDSHGQNIKIVLLARNPERALSQFGSDHCSAIYWDASSPVVPDIKADYLIHLACDTSSAGFLNRPVETINTIVDGTKAILECAGGCGARTCVASTMEVYAAGGPDPLPETAGGALDAMNPRNSYPEAKQLAETLVAAYAAEFNVTACVARLCQTFGVGVHRDDGRVFAEFARKCISGNDIVLLTPGDKKNMYLSVQDAALALILLLIKGEAGSAYNVANKVTFCSVRDMAQMVIASFGAEGSKVRVEIDPNAAMKFRAPGEIYQDTSKIEDLGWSATGGLSDIYRQMLEEWLETQPVR